jgi:hypothetical protein
MDYQEVDNLLGPAYPLDTRPTNFQPTSKPAPGLYIRANPYELGTPRASDASDYWSDSGQYACIHDNPDHPGLTRIQTYAHYEGVFAISPRLDKASGSPDPDSVTSKPGYITANGGPLRGVVAMVRAVGTRSNDAFVLWESGLVTPGPTQTGKDDKLVGWPSYKLPERYKPLDMAVTSNNELLLIACWDTERSMNSIVILMIEGRGIPIHTFGEMGLFNQASISAFAQIAVVDLGLASNIKVAAASNGVWTGPSMTNNKTLGQLDKDLQGLNGPAVQESTRSLLYSGAWSSVISRKGYFVVTSEQENKMLVFDLMSVFHYIRNSWLSSVAQFKITRSERIDRVWPPDAGFPIPLILDQPINGPQHVLCGHSIDRWSPDRYKFHVACADGHIEIWDASSLMKSDTWSRLGALSAMGTFHAGANPVKMCFNRHSAKGTILPLNKTGDGRNNVIWVACREERTIKQFLTYGGQHELLRPISDIQLDDPVDLIMAERGPVLVVADFRGRKIISFRVGGITDTRAEPDLYYPTAEGRSSYEVAGVLPVSGHPYLVSSVNVN